MTNEENRIEEIEIIEELETEEIEFSLTDLEIEEWIEELIKLKEGKNQINLSIDEETELKINYEESEEEEYE